MNRFDIHEPSRAEFVQQQMQNAPRFSLFPVGTRVPNIDEAKIFPRAIVGTLTSFSGTLIDTANHGKVALALEKILPSNRYLSENSLAHTTQFLWTITLAAVGYTAFSLIEHAIKKSNFSSAVQTMADSEYGHQN